MEIQAPAAQADIVKAKSPQVHAWEMPEHYVALPCDFDFAGTLEPWEWASDRTPSPRRLDLIRNMRRGWLWAFGKQQPAGKLLTVAYACRLHKEMFGNVFNEAGIVKTQWQFPGASECKATSRLRCALEAAANGLVAERPVDDIAIELHGTLAGDRAFAQGSSVHARAMADLLLVRSGASAFTWGVSLGADADERIERYRSCFRYRHSAPLPATEALAFARA